MTVLNVFLDRCGSFQRIGALRIAGEPARSLTDAAEFTYERSFLDSPNAVSVSLSLPLQSRPFDQKTTMSFFDGLLPEGRARTPLAESLHVSSNGYLPLLERLSDETAGALVFSLSQQLPGEGARYLPMSPSVLEDFAHRPRKVAFETGMATRLSLAGAESKLGLYHRGDDFATGWYVPQGTAPSTHIIKASDGTFEGQTINEALCLGAARACGFDVPECRLLPIGGCEPLLVVERFDRCIPSTDTALVLDGCEVPRRLHQEDFCQASGLRGAQKYEPTGGHYLNRCGDIIARSSSNPFGDRAYFLQRIYLDFFLGNCDNHLKNHSILWSEDFSERSLAPVYDLTCTTVYPWLDREMGVSLCASRKIDDVTVDDLIAAAKELGVGQKLARSLLEELREALPSAFDSAEKLLLASGQAEDVEPMVEKIRVDMQTRLHRTR